MPGRGVEVIQESPALKPVRDETRQHAVRPYAFALLAVAAALGAGKFVEPLVGLETIDLLFLTAVLVVAASFGLMPSLFASTAASLAYNYFFLPPTRTLTIAAPANIAAFAFFILAAVLVSNLAARVRNQMLAAKDRARTTEALYAFSRKIAGIADLDDLLWAAAYQIASMLRVDVVFLLPGTEDLEVKAAYPPDDMLGDEDIRASRSTYRSGSPAGRDTDEMPGAKRHYLPIGTAQRAIGVVGVTRERRGVLLAPDERRLLEALLDQTAIAIERIELARGIDEARIAAETERLRAALLTSLSHDLKTPLASITGAATSLRQYGQLYDAAEREDLISMIESEADRLGRFVANLLDMTRLEAGSIELRREPVDIGDVVGTALDRCSGLLNGYRANVSIPSDLPMLSADAVLLEQVLVNLFDNAVRYGSPESGFCVRANRTDLGVTIEVLDEGPGLPPAELERVFEKFHRLDERDRHRAGTGLGLAICRGFVEALGGTISAANREDGPGAVFSIRFPSTLFVNPGKTEPGS